MSLRSCHMMQLILLSINVDIAIIFIDDYIENYQSVI